MYLSKGIRSNFTHTLIKDTLLPFDSIVSAVSLEANAFLVTAAYPINADTPMKVPTRANLNQGIFEVIRKSKGTN